MTSAPPLPTSYLDARIEDGRLTVLIHGLAGAVGLRLSIEDTRGFYRLMGQHLEPRRFDGRG